MQGGGEEADEEQHESLEDAALAAIAAQPTGFTLSTTSVQTKVIYGKVWLSDCLTGSFLTV